MSHNSVCHWKLVCLSVLAFVVNSSSGDAGLIDFDLNPYTGAEWGFDVGRIRGDAWRQDYGVNFLFRHSNSTVQRNLAVIRQGDPGHAFATSQGDDFVYGEDERTNFFISDDDVIQTFDPGTLVMQFDEKQSYVSAAILDVDQQESWAVRTYRSNGAGGIELLDEIVLTPADGGDGRMAFFEFDRPFAEIVEVEMEYLGISEPLGFAFDRVFTSATPVPEPGTTTLALLAVSGLGIYRKRNQSNPL